MKSVKKNLMLSSKSLRGIVSFVTPLYNIFLSQHTSTSLRVTKQSESYSSKIIEKIFKRSLQNITLSNYNHSYCFTAFAMTITLQDALANGQTLQKRQAGIKTPAYYYQIFQA